MILIVGGAYQGKLDYAVTRFGLTDAEIVHGADCPPEEALNKPCITGYHSLVKRLMEAGAEDFTVRLCQENPDAVVILDEIGCGIIPLKHTERQWREAVGRCGCILAEQSETVIRMICGVPTAIKGELP